MISNDLASRVYRPLDISTLEIRILRFLPHPPPDISDQDIAQINCALEYIKLDSKPVYNALSYTWKDYHVDQAEALFSAPEKPTIFLDGHEVPVTRNLWLALTQFQKYSSQADGTYFGPFPAGTRLWVDALCINQTDIKERNHQVRQMRQIYQTAECVNVWLGPEFEESNLGMEFALDLEQRVRALGSTKVQVEWINPLMRSRMNVSTHEGSWKALTRVHQRPYWQRLWIIQEIVSNMRTYVHIGAKTTHLMPLLTTGQAISETDDAQSALVQTSLERGLLDAFESQAIVADRYSYMDPTYDGHNLLDLLRNYRHHRSSDPRDKVYGLAGLARSYDDKGLLIDYDLPVRKVFLETTRYIIEGTKRLDAICSSELTDCSCNSAVHEDVVLPSWVPNWDCLPKHWTRIKFDAEIPWNAALDSKAVAKISPDRETLTCKGLELGLIERIHQPEYRVTSWEETLEAFRKLLLFLYQGQSQDECFQPQLGTFAGVDIPKTLWEIFFCHQALRDMASSPLPFERFKTVCTEVVTEPPNHGLLRVYENDVVTFFRTLSDRSIFTTTVATNIPSIELKPAIGACPPCAREGDQIALLYGCKTLVNLRRDPKRVSQHAMVSVCCLNGYMYGEAMGKVAERDFEIH
jgi:Heterokaryon incompatibility protein (HET)